MVLKLAAGVVMATAVPLVMAADFQWEMVELPTSSGAACGDGSPYRFFVNRNPLSTDMVIVYEGGGACWDQKGCQGAAAVNPNGIPADYMNQAPMGGNVTPFSGRFDPYQYAQTQSWNIVYMPYCTGDLHAGNKVTVYTDSDPANPRVQYHRGYVNQQGAAAWLRANFGRPTRLLMTGFSAGGVGSTLNYAVMRDTLQPTNSASLLPDSGPLMPAPRNGSTAQYPSIPFHNKIRDAYGMDAPGGLITTKLSSLPGFRVDDLGSIVDALASAYPSDRFGYMVFQADVVFSAVSYTSFYPDITSAPDSATARQLIMSRWNIDLANWTTNMQRFANVGYHLPYYRNFSNSHCLTQIDFSGTGIEEKNIADLSPFVNSTIDRGPVMRNIEMDHVTDLSRPVSPILTLINALGSLGG
jgi:hypothetical protein